MSSLELQRYDSLEQARQEIMRALPEHFRFGVPAYEFSDLPIGEALQKRAAMRAFEREMDKLNYRIHHSYSPADNEKARGSEWVYDLRRYNRVEPEPETPGFRPQKLEKDQPIDI